MVGEVASPTRTTLDKEFATVGERPGRRTPEPHDLTKDRGNGSHLQGSHARRCCRDAGHARTHRARLTVDALHARCLDHGRRGGRYCTLCGADAMIAPGEPRIDGDRALEEIAREGGAWRVVRNRTERAARRRVARRTEPERDGELNRPHGVACRPGRHCRVHTGGPRPYIGCCIPAPPCAPVA